MKENITRSQRELEVKTSKLLEARENASNQVALDWSFESDWLRKWREFSGPITKRSKAKTKQSRITLDIHLKITLNNPQEKPILSIWTPWIFYLVSVWDWSKGTCPCRDLQMLDFSAQKPAEVVNLEVPWAEGSSQVKSNDGMKLATEFLNLKGQIQQSSTYK